LETALAFHADRMALTAPQSTPAGRRAVLFREPA